MSDTAGMHLQPVHRLSSLSALDITLRIWRVTECRVDEVVCGMFHTKWYKIRNEVRYSNYISQSKILSTGKYQLAMHCKRLPGRGNERIFKQSGCESVFPDQIIYR